MHLYHISSKLYQDLRPLKLIKHGQKKLRLLIGQGHLSKDQAGDYSSEINFFFGKPSKEQITKAISHGFKNWDMDKVYIYRVNIRDLRNSNYVSVTSTPQQISYDDANWDNLKEDATKSGLSFDEFKKAYKEQRTIRLSEYGVPYKTSIDELLKNRHLKDWSDFDKYFEINLKKGNKGQYASYIPHVQVSVNKPVVYDSVELVDLTEGSSYLERQKKLFKTKANRFKFTGTLESLIDAEESGFLFHGSLEEHKVLKINKTHLDRSQVVFAGKLWIGLSFIPEWNDDIVELGSINGIPHITGLSSRLRNIFNVDGYIHLVSPETFQHNDRLMESEFLSTVEVPVIYSVRVTDLLNKLKELGVVTSNESTSINPIFEL